MNNHKVIFWDFDGVLMNSNPIRDLGFIEVLSDFPSDQVQKLLDFHRENGGLSRYVKFRYFFEKIIGEQITEAEIDNWAKKFSNIMLKLLVDETLLISETMTFVKMNQSNYTMHIVSGSDGNELNYICEKLQINKYFKSISGSPTPKKELVDNVIKKYNYNPKDCILIGDSINDFDAADSNNILFYGYNNPLLKKYNYLENINSLNVRE